MADQTNIPRLSREQPALPRTEARRAPMSLRRKVFITSAVAAAAVGHASGALDAIADYVAPRHVPPAGDGVTQSTEVQTLTDNTYRVQPGDTAWNIADAHTPEGEDIRPLSDRLAAQVPDPANIQPGTVLHDLPPTSTSQPQ